MLKIYVLRGSSWDFDPVRMRSAYRDWSWPGARTDNLSFRIIEEY